MCETGYYRTPSNTCITDCSTLNNLLTTYINNNELNECVTSCSPNFHNIADNTCYKNCPDPYYNKVFDYTC